MSWFSRLVETFDAIEDVAGSGELTPRYHMLKKKTNINVILDADGNFVAARGEDADIVIPCTSKSGIRTSGVSAHPLHVDLGYLALNPAKHEDYLKTLAAWSHKHPKVAAVHKYILKETLLADLEAQGMKKLDDQKQFVRWSVETPGDLTPELWKDKSVAEAWIAFSEELERDKARDICYATGSVGLTVAKHPKGVNASSYGAKLISCNDNINYTYRGRFTQSSQANAISAAASFKAHEAFRYLILKNAAHCGTQAIVAWAIDKNISVPPPLSDKEQNDLYGADDIYGESSDEPTALDAKQAAEAQIDTLYADFVRKMRAGYGKTSNLTNHARKIAVIAEDVTTAKTGRMSVIFYQELDENEYIDRLVTWNKQCCWFFTYNGKQYVAPPKTDDIIAAVFGEQHGDGYEKIKKQARERLLHFIVNREPIDRSWIGAAVSRVTNPFSYENNDTSGFNIGRWHTVVAVTCAIARKYYMDKGDEFKMELEKDRTDRDYLFGRLLAIYDKIEQDARYKQLEGRDDSSKRPTNATRYMSAFTAKPFSTWLIIRKQLEPYYLQLNGADWYQKQIDEIIALNPTGLESNKPLDAKFLIGYSLQRNELFKKKQA